jgi:hypothetical protein
MVSLNRKPDDIDMLLATVLQGTELQKDEQDLSISASNMFH